MTERDGELGGAAALSRLQRHGGTVDFVAYVFAPVHGGDKFGQFIGRVS